MSDNEIINIDSRSHLEVADTFHRYAKNLRYYFKEYNKMFGCSSIIESGGDGSSSSTQKSRWSRYDPFFRWLDESVPRPNLSCCPRAILDSDTVTYMKTDADRAKYEVEFSPEGLLKSKLTKDLVSTGPKGWIFVLKQNRMFACEKRTESPRLQHSSFFGGDVVNAAGMIVSDNGVLTTLFPHSGHYRPLNSHLCSLLRFFHLKGINLRNVQVDVQRVFKTTRLKDSEGGKVKKTDTPYFKDGEYVFNFLRAKQNFLHSGFLFQIESVPRLKKTQPTSHNTTASVTSAAATTTFTNETITEEDDNDEDGDVPSALNISIPAEPDNHHYSHYHSSSSSSHSQFERSVSSSSIPIQPSISSNGLNSGSVGGGMVFDKPWLSSSYDPPSESSSPITYAGYLSQAFMESFQRSHSASNIYAMSASSVGGDSLTGSGCNSASNAAMMRAKVLGRSLVHTNSGGINSNAKDVALLLAESPSMLLLSQSNGSSRAHTPGGYPRNRIRTLSETSRPRAQESQDDLYSLGIATTGSRDVNAETGTGSCSGSSGSDTSSEDVLNMLDIHASLLVT